MKLISLMILILLTSCCGCCTLNISIVNSQGSGTDTLDDNQTEDPTVNTTATVPLSIPNPLSSFTK